METKNYNISKPGKTFEQILLSRYSKACNIIHKIKKNRINNTPRRRDEQDWNRCMVMINEYRTFKKEKLLAEGKPTGKKKTKGQKALVDSPETSRVSLDIQKDPIKSPEQPTTSQASYNHSSPQVIIDPLCMALANDFGGAPKPVVKEWATIEIQINDILLKYLLNNTNCPIPHYEMGKIYRGFLLIKCRDDFSKEFLGNCINKIHKSFTGMTLSLIPAACIQNDGSVSSTDMFCGGKSSEKFKKANDLQLVENKRNNVLVSKTVNSKTLDKIEQKTSSTSGTKNLKSQPLKDTLADVKKEDELCKVSNTIQSIDDKSLKEPKNECDFLSLTVSTINVPSSSSSRTKKLNCQPSKDVNSLIDIKNENELTKTSAVAQCFNNKSLNEFKKEKDFVSLSTSPINIHSSSTSETKNPIEGINSLANVKNASAVAQSIIGTSLKELKKEKETQSPSTFSISAHSCHPSTSLNKDNDGNVDMKSLEGFKNENNSLSHSTSTIKVHNSQILNELNSLVVVKKEFEMISTHSNKDNNGNIDKQANNDMISEFKNEYDTLGPSASAMKVKNSQIPNEVNSLVEVKKENDSMKPLTSTLKDHNFKTSNVMNSSISSNENKHGNYDMITLEDFKKGNSFQIFSTSPINDLKCSISNEINMNSLAEVKKEELSPISSNQNEELWTLKSLNQDKAKHSSESNILEAIKIEDESETDALQTSIETEAKSLESSKFKKYMKMQRFLELYKNLEYLSRRQRKKQRKCLRTIREYELSKGIIKETEINNISPKKTFKKSSTPKVQYLDHKNNPTNVQKTLNRYENLLIVLKNMKPSQERYFWKKRKLVRGLEERLGIKCSNHRSVLEKLKQISKIDKTFVAKDWLNYYRDHADPNQQRAIVLEQIKSFFMLNGGPLLKFLHASIGKEVPEYLEQQNTKTLKTIQRNEPKRRKNSASKLEDVPWQEMSIATSTSSSSSSQSSQESIQEFDDMTRISQPHMETSNSANDSTKALLEKRIYEYLMTMSEDDKEIAYQLTNQEEELLVSNGISTFTATHNFEANGCDNETSSSLEDPIKRLKRRIDILKKTKYFDKYRSKDRQNQHPKNFESEDSNSHINHNFPPTNREKSTWNDPSKPQDNSLNSRHNLPTAYGQNMQWNNPYACVTPNPNVITPNKIWEQKPSNFYSSQRRVYQSPQNLSRIWEPAEQVNPKQRNIWKPENSWSLTPKSQNIWAPLGMENQIQRNFGELDSLAYQNSHNNELRLREPNNSTSPYSMSYFGSSSHSRQNYQQQMNQACNEFPLSESFNHNQNNQDLRMLLNRKRTWDEPGENKTRKVRFSGSTFDSLTDQAEMQYNKF